MAFRLKLFPACSGSGQHQGLSALCVETRGFAQLEEAIRVRALVALPATLRLSAERPGGHGPNSHWFCRLPGALESPNARQRAVEDLKAVWRSAQTRITVAGLNSDPRAPKAGKITMKVFFEHGDQENYGEAFINIDLGAGILEFHDKDPEYHAGILASLAAGT